MSVFIVDGLGVVDSGDGERGMKFCDQREKTGKSDGEGIGTHRFEPRASSIPTWRRTSRPPILSSFDVLFECRRCRHGRRGGRPSRASSARCNDCLEVCSSGIIISREGRAGLSVLSGNSHPSIFAERLGGGRLIGSIIARGHFLRGRRSHIARRSIDERI